MKQDKIMQLLCLLDVIYAKTSDFQILYSILSHNQDFRSNGFCIKRLLLFYRSPMPQYFAELQEHVPHMIMDIYAAMEHMPILAGYVRHS
jgi:hypothetical protein